MIRTALGIKQWVKGATLASCLVVAGVIFININDTSATLKGFDPGDIMSDGVMGNNATMTPSKIQAFLKSQNPCNASALGKLTWYNHTDQRKATQGRLDKGGKSYHYNLRNGIFKCMADETFGGETAAQIIWQAGQDYRINPQVILVLLQKEQGLITDTWPNKNYQYAAATGYNCPDDGGGCRSKNAGFKKQIREASNMFRIVLDGGWSNYPLGKQSVQYSPDKSCGSSTVNIKNRATSSLYRYTPYQPNTAALKAGWGTAPCGAYGNRNFYNYFTEWFGSTRYQATGPIGQKFNSIGGENGQLGIIVSNQRCGLRGDGCYQAFNNGSIYWSQATGAQVLRGGISARWANQGYERGHLGYPLTDEICGLKDGGCYQQFQQGNIYWKDTTGAMSAWGSIWERYILSKSENGTLGYPKTNEICKNGGCYQQFENGRIYWSPQSKSFSTQGAIGELYEKLGNTSSNLRYPISEENCVTTSGKVSCYQQFQGGRIYKDDTNTTLYVHGAIGSLYQTSGGHSGTLGYPKTNEICKNGGCYQQFENGRIYWSAKSRAHAVLRDIETVYSNFGGYMGHLGLPISANTCGLKNNGCYQQFENGRIYFSKATNGYPVIGAIGNFYIRSGGVTGSLGYPISYETLLNGVVSQKFENGTLNWSQSRRVWKS